MKDTFSLTVLNRTGYEMKILPGDFRVLPGTPEILEHRFSKLLKIRLLREGETVRNNYTAKVASAYDYALKYSGGSTEPEWKLSVESEGGDIVPEPDYPVVVTIESEKGEDIPPDGDDDTRRRPFLSRK